MKARRNKRVTRPAPHSAFLRMGLSAWIVAAVVLGVCLSASGLAADAPAEGDDREPAKIDVSGYGLLGNLNLKNTFRALYPGRTAQAALDAVTIEDGLLMVMDAIRNDGFLKARIRLRLTATDGSKQTYGYTTDQIPSLPLDLQASRVEIHVDEGKRYYFRHIKFLGLNAVGVEEARSLFRAPDILIPQKKNKIFSPSRLRRGLLNLETLLHRRGYTEATAEAMNTDYDDRTGGVDVVVLVHEHYRYLVTRVEIERYFEGSEAPASVEIQYPMVPYSGLWKQDLVESLRREQRRQGYADARVETQSRHPRPGEVEVVVRVHSGHQFKIGEIQFEGLKRSKPKFLRRHLEIHAGDRLDRIQADAERRRLLGMGIFKSVGLEYKDIEGRYARDVRYVVEEVEPIHLDLLMGFGSYELLRGGFELEQRNLLGRAHRGRLVAVQSFKSTETSYSYTIPSVFYSEFDVFARARYRNRKETSFTRNEYGGNAGVSRFFKAWSLATEASYNYEILAADTSNFNPRYGIEKAESSNMRFGLKQDLTDNPLYPTRGYEWSGEYEVGASFLGGEADYHRITLDGAYHHSLPWLQVLHFGLSYGLVYPFESVPLDLPFNKRFFPGGENSVRGYQFGDAAPRDATGRIVGAETFLQLNFEVEQPLTEYWALVFFVDTVGIAADHRDTPASEILSSAGGGIRWKTVIGPVRLEYGHNLNPRPEDDPGTVHFSIGYPF